MSFPKIQLTEVLTYLEKEEEEEDKPYLFINPSQDLYTFFKYKGNKIDLVTLISNLSAPEISGDKADLKTLQYSLSEAVRAKKKLLEKINAEVNNIQSALDVIKLE